jgi:hypothetical protein
MITRGGIPARDAQRVLHRHLNVKQTREVQDAENQHHENQEGDGSLQERLTSALIIRFSFHVQDRSSVIVPLQLPQNYLNWPELARREIGGWSVGELLTLCAGRFRNLN